LKKTTQYHVFLTSYPVRTNISIRNVYVRENSFVVWDVLKQRNRSLTMFDNCPRKWIWIQWCNWIQWLTVLVTAANIDASRLIVIDRIALGLFGSIV